MTIRISSTTPQTADNLCSIGDGLLGLAALSAGLLALHSGVIVLHVSAALGIGLGCALAAVLAALFSARVWLLPRAVYALTRLSGMVKPVGGSFRVAQSFTGAGLSLAFIALAALSFAAALVARRIAA